MTDTEQIAWVKSNKVHVVVAGIRAALTTAVQDPVTRAWIQRDLEEIYGLASDISDACGPRLGAEREDNAPI